MSAVMLGQEASSKLAKVHSPVVVLDEGGGFLGHFVPGTPPDLLAMEPYLSREEHEKRFARTSGRTLSEIMSDLEKRA